MNFLELSMQRCSARSYEQKFVEEAKVQQLLNAAWVAPTAANRQPQKVLVLNNSQALEKVSKSANCHGAPLVMVVLADKEIAWVRPFDKKSMVDVDATIVADHIIMQAEDLGLSSCWITFFNPNILKEEFAIPDNLEPVTIISLGYSNIEKDSERHIRTRKPLASMIFYNQF